MHYGSRCPDDGTLKKSGKIFRNQVNLRLSFSEITLLLLSEAQKNIPILKSAVIDISLILVIEIPPIIHYIVLSKQKDRFFAFYHR